jgi:outer membrane protein
MNPKFLWIAVFVACLSAAALGQTPTSSAAASAGQAAEGSVPKLKAAIVFIDAFRGDVEELKIKYQKLQAEFDPRGRELQSMQTNLDAKEKVLADAGSKNMTPQQQRKLADEYDVLKREFERKKEDSQTLARKREEEETSAIYDKLNQFLSRYAAQRGITVVIEGSAAQRSGVLVYAAPTLDITADFVREYNKAFPVAAAKAASAQPKTSQ